LAEATRSQTFQHKNLPALALLACVLTASCRGKRTDQPLSSVMLNALTEPAVFKVVLIAEHQLRDFRFRGNRFTLPQISDSPDCWSRIADAPDMYLSVSIHSNEFNTVRKLLGSGSSFAVDHAGILLTNAHVITSPDTRTLAVQDAVVSLVRGLARPVSAFQLLLHPEMRALGCRAGLPNDEQSLNHLADQLLSWTADKVVTSSRLRTYVVTRPRESKLRFDFGAWGTSKDLWPNRRSVTELFPQSRQAPAQDPDEIVANLPANSDNLEEYATEADVIASGEVFPGEDVAVLRTKKRLDLICLSLGDSSPANLPDGAEIVSFGFPGAAEMRGLKVDEERPRVIAHNGRMVQRVPTVKQWTGLYITSAISEGDSGGPILDQYGRVVGLNVYGNTNRSGNNIGVPIDIARKYLEKAGVQPDTGSLTRHWAKGQDYYWRKEYSKALAEFEIVNGSHPDPDARRASPTEWLRTFLSKDRQKKNALNVLVPGNEYVEQAIENCKRNLQKR
jgi:S1-C subfamily serine protease